MIERIEKNWEAIAASVIAQVQRDRAVAHYQTLSPSEIRERARDLVNNLSYWMWSGNDDEVAMRYEALGRRRCRESVPLHEVIYKLNLLQRKIAAYLVDENYEMNPVEMYGELQLLRQLYAFFDLAAYSVVKGYEAELRAPAPAARKLAS